jgi:hypothetical protein
MKTLTQEKTQQLPSRVFILAERMILSVALWAVTLVVERRLIKAIKRTA